jgi:hypothetical protein
MQNNISFSGEMIFPGNLSLPVIVLGEVELRHDFLLVISDWIFIHNKPTWGED